MKNERIICTLFIGAFFSLISCTNNKLDKEIEVINGAFLKVTDTVAYHELSLRAPSPGPDRKLSLDKSLQNKYAIVVPDTLYPFGHWASSLLIYCKSSDSNENSSLIDLKKQICEEIDTVGEHQLFNINRLKNIGRYILIKDKSQLKSDVPIVGKVQFSQVVFNKEGSLAGFMAFISDTEKAAIEKLFLLERKEGKWKVIKTEIFRVY
jgi:hypothetical protein